VDSSRELVDTRQKITAAQARNRLTLTALEADKPIGLDLIGFRKR